MSLGSVIKFVNHVLAVYQARLSYLDKRTNEVTGLVEFVHRHLEQSHATLLCNGYYNKVMTQTLSMVFCGQKLVDWWRNCTSTRVCMEGVFALHSK